MRTIRFLGGATNSHGRFVAGDVFIGKERDLKPLVDCGVAEWADTAPPELKAQRKSKPPKKSDGE